MRNKNVIWNLLSECYLLRQRRRSGHGTAFLCFGWNPSLLRREPTPNPLTGSPDSLLQRIANRFSAGGSKEQSYSQSHADSHGEGDDMAQCVIFATVKMLSLIADIGSPARDLVNSRSNLAPRVLRNTIRVVQEIRCGLQNRFQNSFYSSTSPDGTILPHSTSRSPNDCQNPSGRLADSRGLAISNTGISCRMRGV